MTHKAKYERWGARIIRTRHMKNFWDLQQKAWSDVETLNDPNDMWSMWKDMLMQSIDKHTPLKSKRGGNKKALWITENLRREMHKQDFLKKKAMLDCKQSTWTLYTWRIKSALFNHWWKAGLRNSLIWHRAWNISPANWNFDPIDTSLRAGSHLGAHARKAKSE